MVARRTRTRGHAGALHRRLRRDVRYGEGGRRGRAKGGRHPRSSRRWES